MPLQSAPYNKDPMGIPLILCFPFVRPQIAPLELLPVVVLAWDEHEHKRCVILLLEEQGQQRGLRVKRWLLVHSYKRWSPSSTSLSLHPMLFSPSIFWYTARKQLYLLNCYFSWPAKHTWICKFWNLSWNLSFSALIAPTACWRALSWYAGNGFNFFASPFWVDSSKWATCFNKFLA